ncbi:MAG: hypothetical protein HQ515_10940, partial [Phycisphaeraceae bacterium]|nr:hypothetical protein [Phycisphaeraceae bacterium]
MARSRKVTAKKADQSTGPSVAATSKKPPVLFDIGRPDALEEAIVLLYALAFGPIEHAVLTQALTLAGLTLPDGTRMTQEKLVPLVQHLHQENLLVSPGLRDVEIDLADPESDIDDLECDVDLRWASFDQAQEKGWLLPLGQILQEVDPAEISETSVEYKWSQQRFASLNHASRDLFLAMETRDQSELARLIQLCLEDQYIPSLAHVLYPVCLDPLHPDHLALLDLETRLSLLYAGLHAGVCDLSLNHPIFEYARTEIPTFAVKTRDNTFSALIALLAERDLLCGNLTEASDLLKTYPDPTDPMMSGMQSLLTGHLDAAKEAFSLAVKGRTKGKKAVMEHLRSFPGVLHVTLLVQSDNLQDRALAKTWLKWGERTYCPYQASFDCLANLLALHQGSVG